jgi:predicted amidohydrolase YtcJ
MRIPDLLSRVVWRKGSKHHTRALEVGNVADTVVLAEDPLSCDLARLAGDRSSDPSTVD